MRNIVSILITTLAVAAAVAGCAKVQEPWTDAPGEQVKQQWETPRTAKQQHELHERLSEIQTDR